MSRNNKIAVQVLGLCVATVMIIYGVSRGETAIIFNKAVNICLSDWSYAVSGSMNFKLSFYVIGFVLALGVVFGRAICGFF